LSDEKETEKLWEAFLKDPTNELREKLIIKYASLVKVVAGRMSMYLGYNVEYDDLVGYGVFGLIESIDRYDPSKNVKFETYASLRIRGAILDQIRKMDWIPRSVRQRQKKYDTAVSELSTRLGRAPSSEEIAEELGISVEELADMESETTMTSMISLDDYLDQGIEVKGEEDSNRKNDIGISAFDSPETSVEKEELKSKIAEAIGMLTEKERTVISLYYYEELNLKEISKVMSVSESRVSQLHSKSLVKLKKQLGEYMEVFTNRL
jgi:RNA polymerase sigma factor for flagellar operon FliA